MIKVVVPCKIACPSFPIGTPVDENGCPGSLCPYYGHCEYTKPTPF